MSKGKGFDPIADAHEVAQHNINPYYWVNRVTSYTYARWMADKRLSILFLPLYLAVWITVIHTLAEGARVRGISVWRIIFDIRDAAGLAILVQLVFLIFYTIIVVISAAQVVLEFRNKRPVSRPPRRKPKKHPKRRKDYGRG